MSKPAFALLLALVALAFAGCLDRDPGEAAVVPASGGEIAPASPTPAETSPASAPAQAPMPEDPASAEEGGGAPDVVVRETPFAWEGNFPVAACVPSGPRACVGEHVGTWKTWEFLPLTGEATLVEATLSWEAAAPDTEELSLALLMWKSCGADCWQGRVVGDPVLGASPVTLSIASPEMDPGYEGLGLMVGQKRPLFAPAGLPLLAYVQHEQPFSVEGILVEEAPA